MTKKVLITGARGIIGTVLRKHLADYQLTLADIEHIDGDNFRKIDVAKDLDALKDAMKGQDAVVHLARDPRGEFVANTYVPENYWMSQNVYRSALETNPHPRVIVASSVHAASGHINWKEEPYLSVAMKKTLAPKLITPDTAWPDSLYGAMKVDMENLGKFYALKGLQVVALRLGGVTTDDKPSIEEENWCWHATWLSHRDCVEIFRRCIEADNLPLFSALFATSNNTYKVFDISKTVQTLGYAPQDDSAKY